MTEWSARGTGRTFLTPGVFVYGHGFHSVRSRALGQPQEAHGPVPLRNPVYLTAHGGRPRERVVRAPAKRGKHVCIIPVVTVRPVAAPVRDRYDVCARTSYKTKNITRHRCREKTNHATGYGVCVHTRNDSRKARTRYLRRR